MQFAVSTSTTATSRHHYAHDAFLVKCIVFHFQLEEEEVVMWATWYTPTFVDLWNDVSKQVPLLHLIQGRFQWLVRGIFSLTQVRSSKSIQKVCGGEYENQEFEEWLDQTGINHELSAS